MRFALLGQRYRLSERFRAESGKNHWFKAERGRHTSRLAAKSPKQHVRIHGRELNRRGGLDGGDVPSQLACCRVEEGDPGIVG